MLKLLKSDWLNFRACVVGKNAPPHASSSNMIMMATMALHAVRIARTNTSSAAAHLALLCDHPYKARESRRHLGMAWPPLF